MSNQILRPTADGNYIAWDGFSLAVPHTPLYDLIDEDDYVVGTGDDDYISTNTAGAAVTVLLSDALAGSWPRATRICSIRIVAVVRQIGASCTFGFRLRSLDQNIDTPVQTLTSTSYTEVGYTFNLGLNAYAWDLSTVNRLEAGLVFATGDEMRCTKLETYVHYEVFPHHTLVPDGVAAGAAQDWSPVPSGTPAYMTVSGVYDGDLSYLADSTVNNQSVFTLGNLPATLSPVNIDRVTVKALVKNVGAITEEADTLMRSAGINYHGGTNTTSVPIQPNGEWHLLTEDYLNDPNVSWPSGNPAATAWTSTEVNALEIGVDNSGGGNFRCTSAAAEVWLAATPPTTINLLPTADGYHQDEASIFGAATAWQAVDEAAPDDATTYVALDADTLGISAYSSFDVGGAGAVPAGERISNVEIRHRVRLDNLPHSEALVAPVMRDTTSGETYVGRPQLLEGMAGTWFDTKWDFHTNPHTGLPWANLAEVTTNMEYGFVVLEGAMLLSRVRVQVQTTQDYRSASVDVTDAEITDVGEAFILRSKIDGTIYGVTEFSVGTGGYTAADPSTVVAVDTAAIALDNDVYRDRVDRIEWDGVAVSPTVDYWCRVPQEVAQGGIGELALWAEIFWSPVPGETGTKFLYAIAHHPVQSRHVNDVHFYKTRVTYWDLGAELLVDGDAEAAPGPEEMTDGDMELAGVASWTAGAGAALTKSVVLPHGGVQALRITDTGGGVPRASQATLVSGTSYRFHGWARGDGGTSVPRVYDHSLVLLWAGTSSAAWQEVDITFMQTGGANIYLYGATSALGWVEFDDVSVQGTAPAWTPGNSPLFSKQTTTPHGGLQSFRIAYTSVGNPYARQAAILTSGIVYRAAGWGRGDGTRFPVLQHTGSNKWVGTTSVAWQSFNVIFVATSANIDLVTVAGGAGYTEWDDMTVREVLSYDFLTHGAEETTDGDMETAGVAAWTAGGTAVLTKQTTAPHTGAQLLRVAGAVLDSAYQAAVLTVGLVYRVTGWARSDGTNTPTVATFAGASMWTGTTSVYWQPFDFVFTAANVSDGLFRWGAGAGAYVEFDDVSIKAVTAP